MSEEILEAFAAETAEILEAVEAAVAELEAGSPEAVDRLFRQVHTLKGSAGIVGMELAELFAHAWENRLGRIRSGDSVPGPETADALLACRDRFAAIVAGSKAFAASSGTVEMGEDEAGALAALDASLSEGARVAAKRAEEVRVESASGETAEAVPDASSSAGPAAPFDEAPRPPRRARSSQAAPQPRGDYEQALESFARVPRRKLDRILSLASELVVSLSVLGRETRAEREGAHVEDALSVVEGLAAQLYRSVLETRMVPVSDVAERYRRAVSEIARLSRKKIRFELAGAETEIDKPVAERLSEPLLHLVRNAADHGVETPEERRAAGKREEAFVRLTARREPGYIELRVEDDGRGIPIERVRERAVEAGYLGPNEAASPEALLELLFEPGFSLSDKVTRWSGRGVGLDAVRGAARALRGEVRIESAEGKGSVSTLRIPVSLSLVEGFIAKAGEYSLLVPFDTVISCTRFEDPGSDRVYRRLEVGGRLLSSVDLTRLYEPGADARSGDRVVVAVKSALGEAGVLVDDVGETITATVRPVDRREGEAPGIAGSAVLGDGRLLLVLDAEEVCRMAADRRVAEQT
ncbi:MAG: Hpt domain-containing protein [Spirochaetales bacterium]|nr:Hpt domain-containing protein [Spirochaetales bacterium]